MIRSFAHKGLEKFWKTGSLTGITPNLATNLRRKLDAMNAAEKIEDLDVPGFHLHALQGARAGQWSVRVTANFRLVFRWEAPEEKGDSILVDIEAVEDSPNVDETSDTSGPAKVNLEDYH